MNVHNLNVGMGLFHAVDKAIAAVDAGATGLIVDDDRHFALITDQFGHVVSRFAGRGQVVGGRGGDGNIAIDAGVKADDGDPLLFGAFQQRHDGLAIQCGEANRGWIFVQCRLQHFNLLVDHRFGLRPFEGDVNIKFCGGLLGAGFHCLPELVLKAFGDDRDVRLGVGTDLGCGVAFSAGGWCRCTAGGHTGRQQESNDEQNTPRARTDLILHKMLL
ncbi:MAG: hypothetical protein R2867_29595 [Caldilineaceae bacterium]